MQKSQIRLSLMLVFAGFSLSLSSCMFSPSTQKPQVASQALKVEHTVGSEPALNQRQRVNVGEVMYSEFEYRTGRAAQTVGKAFSKTVLFGDVKMPRGTLLAFKPNTDYPTYCTEEPVYFKMSQNTASDIACFADENEDGWFDRVQVPSVKFGTWTDTDGPTYGIESVNRKSKERVELVYQGRGENSIKMLYREVNAQGEQTVSQTAEYALNPGGSATQVGFKKARLLIESADNSGITYQVQKSFKE